MVRALGQANMSCHDAQAQVIAHSLSSEAAIAFFDALPTIDVLNAAIGDGSNRGNPAQLVSPKDRDRFALRVVIDAGGMHQRRLAEPRASSTASTSHRRCQR